MNLAKRNRNNAISRWQKIHSQEQKYIDENKDKTKHLKARLLGYIAGDGNILVSGKGKCTHNTLRFYPDHESLIPPFEEAIIKAYNKKLKIRRYSNYFYIWIDSKPLVNDILSFSKLGTLDWELPKKLLKNNKNKIEWLRAFFDAEAHVHKKYIRVQSVNQKGLEEVQGLLKELNIHSKIYYYKPKNPKHNKVFMLTIHRKESQRRYAYLIGFNHMIKLKKLISKLN
jgi:intein/homing endonuclease